MHCWLQFILFGLVAGCAYYEPKLLAPAQNASKLEARTLADPGLRTFVEANAPELAKKWPRRSWDLVELTVVAFFYHPSLEVARAQWGVATHAPGRRALARWVPHNGGESRAGRLTVHLTSSKGILMTHDEILRLPSMPPGNPSYAAGPYRFINRGKLS